MVVARCALCAKASEVPEDHKDYKRIAEKPESVIYVCDMCKNRVRYESENYLKPKKPM